MDKHHGMTASSPRVSPLHGKTLPIGYKFTCKQDGMIPARNLPRRGAAKLKAAHQKHPFEINLSE